MGSSMANLNVQPGKAPSPTAAPSHAPLWDMGFRPFFLGAVVYSAIAMGIWLSAYALGMTPPGVQRYGSLWHAHEMLFGYCRGGHRGLPADGGAQLDRPADAGARAARTAVRPMGGRADRVLRGVDELRRGRRSTSPSTSCSSTPSRAR
jgi:hypothetical protein